MSAKLYLPNHVIREKLNIFKVVADNGREQTVIIPRTGDKEYDDYLEAAYTEKTKEELMKSPATYQGKKTVTINDIKGALHEYSEWRKKRKGK